MSLKYEVMPLVKQCEEITERFKLNKKLFDSGKNVDISFRSSKPQCGTAFPSGLPLSVQRLKQFHVTGEYSDVDIYVGGHGCVAPSHKIILALWSVPFFKVEPASFLFLYYSSCQLDMYFLYWTYNSDSLSILLNTPHLAVSFHYFPDNKEEVLCVGELD